MRFYIVLFALSLIGCETRTSTNTTTTQQFETQTNLMDAKDLDLQAIVGMVKSDKVKSAEDLEKAINADNGLNNVDVDKDGKIDYISVKEGRKGDAISLDLMAIPSGTQNASEGVVVASITFSKNTQTNTVEVSGGYPHYVNGYQDHYYSYNHHGLSFGETMFLAWMFTPRPMYYQSMYYRSYVPRPLYSTSVLTTRRTVYRSPGSTVVSSSRRPSSYTIPSAKVPSRFAPAPRSTGSSFTERSGQGRAFQPRSNTPTRPSTWGSSSSGKSSSFGSSSGSKGSTWGNSSGSRSSGWGSNSSGKSSSWGSSSSGRSSSFGSSSGGKSSSWGSSSGRSSSFGSSSGRSSFGGSSFGGRRR